MHVEAKKASFQPYNRLENRTGKIPAPSFEQNSTSLKQQLQKQSANILTGIMFSSLESLDNC